MLKGQYFANSRAPKWKLTLAGAELKKTSKNTAAMNQ